MQSRPTLAEAGPIVATLPSDWPQSGAKLPRAKRELAARPMASLDELASDEAAPKPSNAKANKAPVTAKSAAQTKAGEAGAKSKASPQVAENLDDEAAEFASATEVTDSDAPVGGDESEVAVPDFETTKGHANAMATLPLATQTAQAQATALVEQTLADKLESVLDTLPNEIVQFIEEEMRARFVAVKIC